MSGFQAIFAQFWKTCWKVASPRIYGLYTPYPQHVACWHACPSSGNVDCDIIITLILQKLQATLPYVFRLDALLANNLQLSFNFQVAELGLLKVEVKCKLLQRSVAIMRPQVSNRVSRKKEKVHCLPANDPNITTVCQ